MMIIPIILIAGSVFLMRKYGESNNLKVCRVRDNSSNILDEKFARGEITEEEYYRIKSTLNNRQ